MDRPRNHLTDLTLRDVGSWADSYHIEQQYDAEIDVAKEPNVGNEFEVPNGVISAPPTPTQRLDDNNSVPVGDTTAQQYTEGYIAPQDKPRQSRHDHVVAANCGGSANMVPAPRIGVDVTAWQQQPNPPWSTHNLYDGFSAKNIVDKTSNTGQWVTDSRRR